VPLRAPPTTIIFPQFLIHGPSEMMDREFTVFVISEVNKQP